MSTLASISDADFEAKVLNATKPVLVDFWAEWCGPCKAIAPILEEIAQEYSDNLDIVKMNVDENTEAPAKYGIRSIPTLLLFKNGNIEGTKVGSMTKSQLAAFLDTSLS